MPEVKLILSWKMQEMLPTDQEASRRAAAHEASTKAGHEAAAATSSTHILNDEQASRLPQELRNAYGYLAMWERIKNRPVGLSIDLEARVSLQLTRLQLVVMSQWT